MLKDVVEQHIMILRASIKTPEKLCPVCNNGIIHKTLFSFECSNSKCKKSGNKAILRSVKNKLLSDVLCICPGLPIISTPQELIINELCDEWLSEGEDFLEYPILDSIKSMLLQSSNALYISNIEMMLFKKDFTSFLRGKKNMLEKLFFQFDSDDVYNLVPVIKKLLNEFLS